MVSDLEKTNQIFKGENEMYHEENLKYVKNI